MAPTGLGPGALLAHQGGWDEILMVLTPIALFAALLWLANSRATRLQDQRSAAPTEATPTEHGPQAADDPPDADDPPVPPDGRPPADDRPPADIPSPADEPARPSDEG